MDKIKEIEVLCKPVLEYLNNNYNPHCSVIVSIGSIKVVSTEICIPLNEESD